ncbi:N-acetylmuramoyl-L-alanine amidase [Patescibacteria group bacterium]|nr:N-acetylmuramoyl-L-alanine amidase [Patescibacteria group bacterium]
MKSKKIFLLGLVLFFVAIFVSRDTFGSVNFKEMIAGMFFVQSISVDQLHSKYILADLDKKRIKILIVPGHDNKIYGTSFNGVKEADLNLELAENLTELLRKERQFEVSLLRSSFGYDSSYLTYINSREKEIYDFQQEHKEIMNNLIEEGKISLKEEKVEHNTASFETVEKLYGVNKWANDNDIDVVIHIHFNDYPGRKMGRAGEYSGYSVYIPEKQYSNYRASYSLAKSVSKYLGRFLASSNFPKEKNDYGIVEDQELIAVGAFNTSDSVSLLIEYGYIYEPQFTDPNVRKNVLKELATQTYSGVVKYFNDEANIDDTFALPYSWENDLERGSGSNSDNLALQIYLANAGFYPPTGFDLNDCPVSGKFGFCTSRAVKEFQTEYSITPASGLVGPSTRTKLNGLNEG